MKEDSFRFGPTNNDGHLITSTTLLEIKSMPKDTSIKQYATKTKLNAKSCKAKCSVQITWIEGK